RARARGGAVRRRSSAPRSASPPGGERVAELLDRLGGGPAVAQDASQGAGDRLRLRVLEDVATDGAADRADLAGELHAPEQLLVRDDRAAGDHDRRVDRAHDL